jgi:hypothetical protein
MKWNALLFGSLTFALIAGCGGERRNNTSGTAGSESGTMQAGAPDTSMRMGDTTGAAAGMSSDTSRTGARLRSDSAKVNR